MWWLQQELAHSVTLAVVANVVVGRSRCTQVLVHCIAAVEYICILAGEKD